MAKINLAQATAQYKVAQADSDAAFEALHVAFPNAMSAIKKALSLNRRDRVYFRGYYRSRIYLDYKTHSRNKAEIRVNIIKEREALWLSVDKFAALILEGNNTHLSDYVPNTNENEAIRNALGTLKAKNYDTQLRAAGNLKLLRESNAQYVEMLRTEIQYFNDLANTFSIVSESAEYKKFRLIEKNKLTLEEAIHGLKAEEHNKLTRIVENAKAALPKTVTEEEKLNALKSLLNL